MPAIVDRNNPFVRVLSESVSSVLDSETISVGRDGASDAICFIDAGVPAVEFGPIGGGHHGPAEWVSASSLRAYRRTLVDFVRRIPEATAGKPPPAHCLRKSLRSERSVIVVDRRRRDHLHARCSFFDDTVDKFKPVQGGTGRGADAGRERQAADDHDRRLRPPPRRQEARPQAALGHDHPDAHRPRQGRRAAVAAARPEGEDPRPRHGQAQRRLHARRPEALDQDGQEPHRPRDQPLRGRQLPRLRGGRERARLRVRRRRPPLLQRQRRASGSGRTTR